MCCSRAVQVGLQRQYYDIASWPQELQQQVVKPAVAAAAKGKGLQVPTAAAAAPTSQQSQQEQPHNQGPQGLQHLMQESAVPQAGPELEALRQRLWAMLQTEADACGV